MTAPSGASDWKKALDVKAALRVARAERAVVKAAEKLIAASDFDEAEIENSPDDGPSLARAVRSLSSLRRAHERFKRGAT